MLHENKMRSWGRGLAALGACLALQAPSHGTDLSAIPPNLTTSVQPNFVVTLDDSGSMAGTALGDHPPQSTDATGNLINAAWNWDGGPWRCAGQIDASAGPYDANNPLTWTMNGVFYNPNITYQVPADESGNPFPDFKGTTLASVPVDGIAVAVQSGSGVGFNPKAAAANAIAGYYGNPDLNGTANNREVANIASVLNKWNCGKGALMNFYGNTAVQPAWDDSLNLGGLPGGPYYYRYKGPPLNVMNRRLDTNSVANLYTKSNWARVPVPSSQYQNFAIWYAYYRTRSSMARSALSVAFSQVGSPKSAPVRVAWQNLGFNNSSTSGVPVNINNPNGLLKLGSSMIAALDDTTNFDATQTYRKAFFTWIFNTVAFNGTPSRVAVARAGAFFGAGNTAGNNTNPYWQSTGSGTGQELFCRQNYSLLVTDGFWNADTWNGNGSNQSASSFAPTATAIGLPDGKTYAPSTAVGNPTTIFNGPLKDNSGSSDDATMSNIAFHFWANNLRTDKVPNTSVAAGNGPVSPYFGDLTTGITGSLVTPSAASPGATPEVYWNPANDPATWPHMNSSFITLGSGGQLNSVPNDLDCKQKDAAGNPISSDACALRQGTKTSLGSTSWPLSNGGAGLSYSNPLSNGIPANVDDLWHAAINSRGSFFVASDPSALATQISAILNNITTRGAQSGASSPTMSILTSNTDGFVAGYDNATWSGTLYKVPLDSTGRPLPVATNAAWEAGCLLTPTATAASCPGGGSPVTPANRKIVTGQGISSGTNTIARPLNHADVTPTTCTSLLSCVLNLVASLVDGLNSTLGQLLGQAKYTALNQIPGTGVPMCASGKLAPIIGGVVTLLGGLSGAPAGCDGLADQRIDYLRGDRSQEGASTAAQFRTRASVLGAIVNSQPVYVSSATSGWVDAFPATSPEAVAKASDSTLSYRSFVSAKKNRPAVVYVGAADGMLHAFSAATGQENWAYVPGVQYNRAVNASGNVAVNSSVGRITNDATPPSGVDDTPIVTDVFLKGQWRTVLVGGMRLGGRGLYAIDVTDPTSITSEASLASAVMWDIDNTTTAGTGSSAPKPYANLGYTYASQNIVRINCSSAVNSACSGNGGTWAVLVSSGYFPNVTSGDPAAAEPGATRTSLFVVDLATGNLIREIPTSSNNQNLSVPSYGLSTPAAYDIGNDQIIDVAVAGDLAGNLWRFDISDPDPGKWTVDLMFQTYDPTANSGLNMAGTHPISSMPVALHDALGTTPVWVFGTGKYLGKCDATTSTLTSGQTGCGADSSAATQSFYGIFDYGTKAAQYPVNKATLLQQQMTETGSAGATVRVMTPQADAQGYVIQPSATSYGGWQVQLNIAAEAGERVVTTVTALYDSNSFVATTLIPSGGNACVPAVSGALLILNAANGGPVGQNLGNSFGLTNFGGSGSNTVAGIVNRNDSRIPPSGSVSVLVPPGGGKYSVPFGSKSFTIDGAQIPHRGAWRQLLELL